MGSEVPTFVRDGGEIVLPVALELSPIRQLLIVDLTDDPIYATLEPQVLETAEGSGTLLLAYRHDGRVEVYAPPGLEVDATGYDGLGDGLDQVHRAPFEQGRFEVTDDGLQLDIAFTSPTGRRFDLHLHEHLRGPRDRIELLAPVGGSFENPAFFPFLWLPRMSFVPIRGTQVDLRIDGETRSIARLPVPIGGRRCLMARYDVDVLVCLLNPASVGTPGRSPVRDRRVSATPDVEVVEVAGGHGVASLRVGRGRHTCAARFEPPMPDARAVADGASLTGAVLLQADGRTELRAQYRVTRAGDRVQLTMAGFGPWRTRTRRPLLAVLFRLPLFRRWPTTYRWDAAVDVGSDPGIGPVSRWTRRSA